MAALTAGRRDLWARIRRVKFGVGKSSVYYFSKNDRFTSNAEHLCVDAMCLVHIREYIKYHEKYSNPYNHDGHCHGEIETILTAGRLSHGIGRSGNVAETQPKALGSSVLNSLANSMALEVFHVLELESYKKALILTVYTGMALTLSLLTLKQPRPSEIYVIFPGIDQKFCLKNIFAPETISSIKASEILCILSTISCFAPRVLDSLIVNGIFARMNGFFYLVNNAYGIQSPSIISQLSQALSLNLIDIFVQSTDKKTFKLLLVVQLFLHKANYVEATTMPFVACTAWAALVTATKYINPNNDSGLRALIHDDSAQWSDNVMKSWKNSVYVIIIKIPNIDRVYKFDEVPTAYIHSSNQDVRGKIVIDVAGDDSLSAGKEIADDPFLTPRVNVIIGKIYRISINLAAACRMNCESLIVAKLHNSQTFDAVKLPFNIPDTLA
uniref:O-phosphoseryl-tRNA(Sec) selenium transferase n=1 Tax=Panagrolaimus davidi TaxID=227884 RepID=A0A914QQJ9_9BILA